MMISKNSKVFAEANADLDRSAAALGRSPTALCWKCRDVGIATPPEWARLLRRGRYLLNGSGPDRLALSFRRTLSGHFLSLGNSRSPAYAHKKDGNGPLGFIS
jgi:hypothetical protein